MKGSLHFLNELSESERSWSICCRHQLPKLLVGIVADNLTDRRDVRAAGTEAAVSRGNYSGAGKPLVMVRPR